jgi:hypothetical protein
MMKELPLNGFYSGESRKLSDRRCINWIPTPNDTGSLSTLSLMPTVGLNESSLQDDDGGTITAGPITSQIFTFSSNQGKSGVIVKGDKVFFRSVGGGGDERQDFPNAAGDPFPVRTDYSRMATDGLRCVIISPYIKGNNTRDKLAYFDKDTSSNGAFSISTIFGYDKVGLADVTYVGGRFLYVVNNQVLTGFNSVFYSAIGGIEPDVLDFFAPDNLSSKLKGIDVINDRIYLFSEDKTFIYSVTSSTDLPFQNTGEIEQGLYEADAKCRYKGGIAGLFKGVGGGYYVGLLSGGGVQPISPDPINYRIQKVLSDNQDFSSEVRFFSFADKGRDMLCVTNQYFTFCYEAATGMWHERRSIGDRENWQFIGAVDTPENSIFVGDEFKEGPIPTTLLAPFCSTNYDIGIENSELVEREMISAPFNDSNQRMMVNELQPQCEADYSTPTEGWQEAKIGLSMSHDFGNTFEQERALNIGRAGNYTQETRFFNIGYVRQAFTVKLRTLNPYPTKVLRLLTRITSGGA